MPYIEDPEYRPNRFLRNGHLATFYPYLFRALDKLPFKRHRINTPDDDFLDLDFLQQGAKQAVFLCHGLEGDTSSQYIKGMSTFFFKKGFDVIAINYRGCSGEMNKKARAYHSGATDDLRIALQQSIRGYENVHLIGFSLGGNLVLKYAGENPEQLENNIRTITGISVPCDLSKAARVLEKAENKLYTLRFLVSLKRKLKEKAIYFPSEIDMGLWKYVKTLRDFDNYYTGPIHGFKDAEDYYAQSSCLQFLQNINIPSLILNAKDDPFLHPSSFPVEIAKNSNTIYLHETTYGGHVGFYNKSHENYYSELKSWEFIQSQSS
jgi:predicted alpha/beta-fold hydrolase